MLVELLRCVIPEDNIIRRAYRGYKRVFPTKIGIGIDLGVKELAVLSDGTVYHSINKTPHMKKLQYQYNKAIEQKKKKEAKRIYKQMEKMRFDYIDSVVKDIVSKKPKYITIEDLHFNYTRKSCETNSLHAAIRNQHLEYFVKQLTKMCKSKFIPLRQVSNSFPSSKMCSKCGYINNKLTLADRVYICPKCNELLDRDLNASYNLRDARKYHRLA